MDLPLDGHLYLSGRVDNAIQILNSCIGDRGAWADPTRYRYQCWTRDFALAMLPYLLRSSQEHIVREHLCELSERQRTNGQIPILYLDRPLLWLGNKIRQSFQRRRMSFMLKRYLTGNLWNLTPGTRDSELYYIIAMHEYTRKTGHLSFLQLYEKNVHAALKHIEHRLLRNGLLAGCDWRDTMEKELGRTPLLTNNSQLYRAYSLLGETEKAELLKQRIDITFWDGEQYRDYPGSTRFDPLGGAFAVLYDIVPPERYHNISTGFRSVDSDLGVTIQCKHNYTSPEELEVIERTQGVVVWPFVVGFSALALLKMGETEFAYQQFLKMLKLQGGIRPDIPKGFYEWYDPDTGIGYGAPLQMWSASLLYQVYHQFIVHYSSYLNRLKEDLLAE